VCVWWCGTAWRKGCVKKLVEGRVEKEGKKEDGEVKGQDV
jgi:hypothetical protein